ncbi:MAG: NitT/TauT family transport system substrate-binding protein [Hyphomicrobiales bacterium]|nr:NitT/TauT family transport system substrate-binding protein [Hyphomicrobiales bacterium]
MRMRKVVAASVLTASAAFGPALPASAQETTIRIGTVRSVATVSNYTAIEKGWWKDLGIKVEIEDLDTSANVISLLATNRLQVVEGGVSAGLFNGLEQNMPLIVTSDRTSTPLGHKILVREDLKGQITKVSDLKGRIVGTNSVAAVTTYELGKTLEANGALLKDIDMKAIAFPLMGAAFKNKALDATLIIQPWATQLIEEKIAVELADPDDNVKIRPLTIAVTMVNTDWAKANPELVRKFFVGYMRGVREYCLAYHHGANREEMVDRGVRTSPSSPRAFFEKYPWPSRNMDGRVNMPSVMDMQDYFKEVGMVKTAFPAERIVTTEYIDHANKVLGPLPAVNPDSKLQGCR